MTLTKTFKNANSRHITTVLFFTHREIKLAKVKMLTAQ